MVISSENVPRRGLHPYHLVAGVAPVSMVSRRATLSAIARRRSVRSRGPEQSSDQVTCLASDQIDGALSKGVTERLGIAEGRIVKLEGRLLEAETLEVQLRQQVVTLQAGQEQMRRQGEELHREAREKRGLQRGWRKPMVKSQH